MLGSAININWVGNGMVLVSILLYFLSLNTVQVSSISVNDYLTLSRKELDALTEFKKNVMPRLQNEKNFTRTDAYLIRWLRAKNMNVKQAGDMLFENFKLRKQYNVDSIQEEDWSDLVQDFPYTNDTTDFAGRPIGSFSISDWDIRRAVASGNQIRVFKYMIKLLDEAANEVYRLQGEGKNVTQYKVLLNMDGFNLAQHSCSSCLPGFSYFSQAYEKLYPGMADAIVIINTPAAFQVILNLVRPIFTPQTREALKVFGSNKAQWMKYLDSEIARDQRYPEFGGTRQHKQM